MLAYMSRTMMTPAYGKWDVDIWEVLLGKFMGKIPGCPFATALILDWKEVFFCIKWVPPNLRANSLHQESLYWSAVRRE